MNFVDTTAYKGIRFETKQNLNYRLDFDYNYAFQYLDLTSAHNPREPFVIRDILVNELKLHNTPLFFVFSQSN